jgi:hypothetical protein
LLVLALPLLYYGGAIYLTLHLLVSTAKIDPQWLRYILYGLEILVAIGMTVVAQDAWRDFVSPQQDEWARSINAYEVTLHNLTDSQDQVLKGTRELWFLRVCKILSVAVALFLLYLWADAQFKAP